MSKEIKQYTTVYHEVYGKGHVLSVKYRRNDNLLFCSFGLNKHGFITDKQLRRGDGEITLQPVRTETRRPRQSLEDALKDLLTGGGF